MKSGFKQQPGLRTLAFYLALLFAFPPAICAQRRNSRSSARPLKARFMVKATFEESYKFAKDESNERVNHDSKLKVEVSASRWVVIGKNEVGNVEFQPLDGGEPPSASGAVGLDAVFDSTSGETSIHATKKFNGRIAADAVSLTLPDTTELGAGLKFTLELHTSLQGLCHATVKSSGSTQTVDDCSDPAGAVALGLGTFGENQSGKTAETPSAIDYGLNFELLPQLYDIEKLKAAGELNSTDVFAQGRRERLDEAYRQKEDPFSSLRWFGSETKGNSQTGYQISFTGQKTQTLPEGQQRIQKLTVTADIIPGGTAATIAPLPPTRSTDWRILVQPIAALQVRTSLRETSLRETSLRETSSLQDFIARDDRASIDLPRIRLGYAADTSAYPSVLLSFSAAKLPARLSFRAA